MNLRKIFRGQYPKGLVTDYLRKVGEKEMCETVIIKGDVFACQGTSANVRKHL